MNWDETTSSLEKLRDDLKQCWRYWTKIKVNAKPETIADSEKKMKLVDDRLKVLEVVHRRVFNRFNMLYLFMGMDPKDQKVYNYECIICMWTGI